MFNQIKRMVNRANRIPDKFITEIFKDKDLQDDIANLNREQMYEDGVDSKGSPLGEYSPRTIQIKTEKGQRTDHITLKDTGEFYDSIKVKSEPGQIVISADTIKEAGQDSLARTAAGGFLGSTGEDVDLANIYGIDILGLTDENLSKIQGFVIPILRGKILEHIRS